MKLFNGGGRPSLSVKLSTVLVGPGSPIEPWVFQEDEDPEIIREKARRVSRENKQKRGIFSLGKWSLVFKTNILKLANFIRFVC